MGFSTKQLRALRRDVDRRKIRTREINGRELSYVEGWHLIAEANRIFGFDGWTRETVESRCILSREVRGTCYAAYACKVRISVFANGRTVIREGHGTGEGQGPSAGEAHDTAIKAAETDATKRALATFGKPFGLSLYLGDRARLPTGNGRQPLFSSRYPSTTAPGAPTASGARHAGNGILPEQTPAVGHEQEMSVSGPELIVGSQNTQSTLPLSYRRRVRDRDHLKFVTNHACLQCGRWPSDAHHITYAQPRALGMKVSDEFTVPLCRLHHREVHRARDEKSWWTDLKIDPLAVANRLWQESHATASVQRPKPMSRQVSQNETREITVQVNGNCQGPQSSMNSNQASQSTLKKD